MGWLRHDLPVEHGDFGKLVPCSCRMAKFESERLSRLLRLSNLGGLGTVTFANLREQVGSTTGVAQERFSQAINSAIQFVTQPQGWLLLRGPGGSGKTQLASAIANACMEQGIPVFFIGVADLLDHLRSAYTASSDQEYDELFDQVRGVPVLILDDLGYHSATPWAQEKLLQLLGHRYNERSATVITTDVPTHQLDERIQAKLQDGSIVSHVEIGANTNGTNTSIDSLGLVELSHLTLENFDPSGNNLRGPIRENLSQAFRIAQNFAESPEGLLSFTGGHGCGKTHLAAGIANKRRSMGDEVLFVFVPDLLDYMRSSFNKNEVSLYEVLEQIKHVRTLFLDDFGEPANTPWAQEKLYQLVNFRGYTKLPTVITTSLPLEAMDPRVRSRLSDARLSDVFEISAPDYQSGIHHRSQRWTDAPRPKKRGRLGP